MAQNISPGYFESYADLGVHQLMLNDSTRNQAYRKAIMDNKSDIRGKVVLDVGAGTGILSIYFAQAGAAKVYAVEASEVYKIAQEIIKENNFEEIITVVHSRIEDLDLPEKVDIIVSEWMGFYLFHEAMLDSVIVARDKFLKPNGLMFPESAALYAAPCSVPSQYQFWNDVDGVSMNCFGDFLRKQVSQTPLTEIIPSECVLTDPEVVIWIDLTEVSISEITSIETQHLTVANKAAGKFQGICLWFTCTFPSSITEPITLSTDPDEPPTHWKQTTIVMPSEVLVEIGTPIAYKLKLDKISESERKYQIEVEIQDTDEVEHPEYCNCYKTKCILVRAMLEKYENDALNGT